MLDPYVVDGQVVQGDYEILVPDVGRCKVKRFLIYDPSGKPIGTTCDLDFSGRQAFSMGTSPVISKFDFILC